MRTMNPCLAMAAVLTCCLLLSGCGGGGEATTAAPTGAVEGYVYVPEGTRSPQMALFTRATLAGYHPVSGATVEATVGGVTRTAVTDADGHFRIELLPEGTATIKITPPLGSVFGDLLTISTTLEVKGNTTAKIGPDGSLSFISHSADRLNVVVNSVDRSSWPRVRVTVSVIDPVSNSPVLGCTDFKVSIDGVEQAAIVTQVGTSVSSPSATALVLDRSGSMEGDYGDDEPLNDLKSAADSYVGYLGSGDVAQIISFSSNVSVDTGFTENKTDLYNAIHRLSSGGGTAIWDAVITAVDSVASRPESQKAVIAMTDGGDNSSSSDVSTAIAHAKSQAIVVYTIGLQGYDFTRSRSKSDAPRLPKTRSEGELISLATETGGEYFYAPTSAQLAGIYTKLTQRMQNPYVIEFTQTGGHLGSTYSVQVEARKDGLVGSNYMAYEARPDYSSFYYSQLAYTGTLPYGTPIKDAGCAVSCAAMMVTQAGARMDPQELADALGESGFLSNDSIKWTEVYRATGNRVRLSNGVAPNWATIDASLASGQPVIVHYSVGGTTWGHWILLVRKDGGQYYVNDPGRNDGCNKTIESSWRWPGGTPADAVDKMVVRQL